MLLSVPPITSGHPKVDSPSRKPEIRGLSDAAKLRGTAVTLAAAGRSSGVTTAITYELRVGTSICESALRKSRSAIANGNVGMKGVSIKKIFEGRWVNTAVLISPIWSAIRAATRAENAESTPVQKKIVPVV